VTRVQIAAQMNVIARPPQSINFRASRLGCMFLWPNAKLCYPERALNSCDGVDGKD
jgi:hypothetical protein